MEIRVDVELNYLQNKTNILNEKPAFTLTVNSHRSIQKQILDSSEGALFSDEPILNFT